MVQYIQLVGGSTDQENSRVAPARSVAIDAEEWNLRIHDGVTPGGHKLVPLDQLPAFEARLFNDFAVWGGGASLSNLSANFTILGAGTFTFQDFTELLTGVPIYIGTEASAATLEVFDSGTEQFRVGTALSTSLVIPANTVATLVKITSGLVMMVNSYTAT